MLHIAEKPSAELFINTVTIIAHYTIYEKYVLVVGVLGYRSGGPGSIPGTTKKT
jgi:hypothetical protein